MLNFMKLKRLLQQKRFLKISKNLSFQHSPLQLGGVNFSETKEKNREEVLDNENPNSRKKETNLETENLNIKSGEILKESTRKTLEEIKKDLTANKDRARKMKDFSLFCDKMEQVGKSSMRREKALKRLNDEYLGISTVSQTPLKDILYKYQTFSTNHGFVPQAIPECLQALARVVKAIPNSKYIYFDYNITQLHNSSRFTILINDLKFALFKNTFFHPVFIQNVICTHGISFSFIRA
jgi:hypothetical protein